MQDKSPLLTVMIPTRERSVTLRSTLKTVVSQRTSDLQILVSDNASQDDTKEVVRGFEDPRIRYVRAPQRMSMCDHWDFAFQYVEGQYLIVIGDDDGIMPGALERLTSIIAANPSAVYFWRRQGFIWPIGGLPSRILLLPPNPPGEFDLRARAGMCIRWGGWGWGMLPSVYHSAVSRRILDALKARTGRVFHSMCPDVFTGYAVPVFAGTARNVEENVTVLGASPKSNSGDGITGSSANLSQFAQEYEAYKWHPKLSPDFPFLLKCTLDSALVAVDLFPEYYAELKFNHEAMWSLYYRTCRLISLTKIVKNSELIKTYGNFKLSRFLCYCWLTHPRDQIRNAFARKVAERRLRRGMKAIRRTDYPQDIAEAVKVIDQLVQQGCY